MFLDRLARWIRGRPVVQSAPAAPPPPGAKRGSVDHVIILDGTLSTLAPGMEGNCGLIYRLLTEAGTTRDRRVYYEPGMQWRGWRHLHDLAMGRGLNRQIRRAYGWLASGYRPGDRIFLFGYSRGAYAVRSLAGVIDRMGLLRREAATERAVAMAYRHYRNDPNSDAARRFTHANCHPEAEIEMVGVFDTVKALGLRLPLLWMLTEKAHGFHNHHLGSSIRHGFHALAIHETRAVFEPILWDCPPGWEGNVQQIWFRGAHGDIGGNIGTFAKARPLTNIPLVWMLDRAEALGLVLPGDWRGRFTCDADSPMVGTLKGAGAIFLLRRPRVMLRDPSEAVHPTAAGDQPWSWMPKPLTRLF